MNFIRGKLVYYFLVVLFQESCRETGGKNIGQGGAR